MSEEVLLFDWDDEVVNDGMDTNFVTLEPGTYDFEVTKFERGTYTPSANAKTPACNQALMTIKITTDDGICTITDKFPMASTMEWKISSFFRSIGLKKHGEPVKMDWNGAIGCKGRAKITKTKGNKEDRYFNNVETYLDPVAGTVSTEGGDEWS